MGEEALTSRKGVELRLGGTPQCEGCSSLLREVKSAEGESIQ